MDQERQETYERIPWEALERPRGDRQWLMVAVAGAVAVGALAYSFVAGRPPAPPLAEPEVPAAVETAPTIPLGTVPPVPVTTVASPILVAEADLYAVDPERLIDRVAAHAEWFAVEYFTVDGSEESRATLASLLPSGVPLPEAAEGTQVFVDWVGAQQVTEAGSLVFEVEVLVRSLRAEGEGGFVRQPARLAVVRVMIGDDGLPRVTMPPKVELPAGASPLAMNLVEVPAQVREQLEQSHGTVVGGEQLADGRWQVVVMAVGLDGVARPTTVVVP